MAQDKVDKLEQKKQELEAELDSIQGELDDSIDRVRDEVSDKLDPKSFIRKHPLPVVGGAVLLGFLLGHEDNGRSGPSTSTSSSSDDNKFMDTVLYELKRMATKKALSFATDFMEQKFDDKVGEHLGETNGIAEE
jgi:hypothetical protein